MPSTPEIDGRRRPEVGPPSAVHDSVELSRLILGVAAAGGADAHALAREAGVPAWLLNVEGAVVASGHHGRLWELAEHVLEDPCVGLTAVTRHQVGDLDLYDYLFTTASTVGQALAVSAEFFNLISTNCSLRAEPPDGDGVTYTYQHALPGGRGEQLWTQFSIAGFCARLAAAAGRPLIPVHVAFAQPAPRSHRMFVETFGTRRIDFDALTTTFTLRAEDVERPLPGADPALARILRRYAATLPQQQPTPADPLGRFHQVLAEALEEGTPSLDALAHSLAVSPRTLQRRLAYYGTTWRAELQIARQNRARRAFDGGAPSTRNLAKELGYSDPRSVRRALRRWDSRSIDPDHPVPVTRQASHPAD